MKKFFLSIVALLLSTTTTLAVSNNTVEIIFNGTTATVNIAENISSYVTLQSGTSSHVKLIQDANFAGVDATSNNTDGEIIYVLSGTSTDGSFYMEGSYKATVNLNGLTLTNPNGPAMMLMDGKRIEVSIKSATTNTLTDGANEDYNGCFHCKGHTKFKGKGTLNVKSNSRHAIYSKEYIEIKNCTINVTGAVKDGIHCKEYFMMESGTVSISGTGDDGIQVEQSSDPVTNQTTEHEDENTGNFYLDGGTLSIQNVTGKAVKADGAIYYNGGTKNFDTSNTEISADIQGVRTPIAQSSVYDLLGRRLTDASKTKGIVIVKSNGKVVKVVRR
ncbi:carbohydrate-binding domain-containing protein [Prevotella sp. E13-17]|uniref:carbohydrate-binding domain-containing protein n=1 Tax=Prevotella sp. E13-17 TaxID=2913616 RepID=UPI001EDB5615|nr:carbohydrate-binding domain-containing protein [Prevotella sp. E13-17]UKK50264.1 carbohydrate-binding domain-containing protein [Prevotella sp. E13-17]